MFSGVKSHITVVTYRLQRERAEKEKLVGQLVDVPQR